MGIALESLIHSSEKNFNDDESPLGTILYGFFICSFVLCFCYVFHKSLTFLLHDVFSVYGHYVVVQSLSQVRLVATPWTTARQAFLFFTTQSLLRLVSVKSVMPSSHLILSCPLFFLPSVFPSIRVFSNDLALCIRWTL